MGGAIRSDDFVREVVPELASAPGGRGRVHRFIAYDLKEQAEQDDQCPGPPVGIYHKSLLYFVSRSLEYSNREPGRVPLGPDDQFEVPMLGLEKYLHTQWPMPDGSLRTMVEAIGSSDNAVIAPVTPLPTTREDQRSGAKGHGEFDDDVDTMTSVLLRIMDRRDLGSDLTAYPKNGMPTHV